MFDIVISTYNRFFLAEKLAKNIERIYSKNINKIIIVDSTLYTEKTNKTSCKIIHLITNHINQPYQRFLGYCLSDSDFILYLDDDMEIINKNNFFSISEEIFKDKSISAISFNFRDKHTETSLSKVPQSIFSLGGSTFKKVINIFTAYPQPDTGKYALCGTRGPKPISAQFTELIGGGAFAVRRDALYKNFNFQLYDLYEKGLGKGEDGILGYSISSLGKIFFISQCFFVHNDQNNSTYSKNIFAFARRVACSRLYLSLEKTRLDKGSLLLARIHYHYYMFWRVMGLIVNYAINPIKNRKDMLLGTLSGWRMAFFFRFDKKLQRKEFWHNEALKDLERNGFLPLNSEIRREK